MINKTMEYLLGEVENNNYENKYHKLEDSTSWSILKEQVMKLEKYAKVFKEIVRSDNKVHLTIDEMPEKKRKELLLAWITVFEDLPDEVEKEEDDE